MSRPTIFTPTLNYGTLVNRQSPLNRGLKHFYMMLPMRGHGSTLFDLVDNDHGGALNGGVERCGALGRPGGFGSLKFDGSNDYASTGDMSEGEDKTGTYSLWAQADAADNVANGTTWFISEGNSASDTPICGIRFSSIGDGSIEGFIRDDASNLVQVGSVPVVANGNWNHIALSMDGANAKLFVNGVQSGSDASLASIGTMTLDQSAIGALVRTTVSSFAKIRADAFRVYNRGLSASEIASLYREERLGYPTTLNRLRLPRFFFPSAGGNIEVTPAAASAVAGNSGPTVVLGSVSITPAPAAGIAGNNGPTVELGSLSLTPAASAAVVTTVNPTVQTGGNIEVTPAAAAAIGAVVNPTIQLGSLSLTPAAASSVVTTLDPAVQLGSLAIAPAASASVGSTFGPTVELGSMTVTPSAAFAVGSVAEPTVQIVGLVISGESLDYELPRHALHFALPVHAAHVELPRHAQHFSIGDGRS